MSRYIDSRHLESQFDEDTLYNGQEVLEVINEEPTADVISLDRLKQAREDIDNAIMWDESLIEIGYVLEILDKLIAESEGKE
jgi:hypothetical protein